MNVSFNLWKKKNNSYPSFRNFQASLACDYTICSHDHIACRMSRSPLHEYTDILLIIPIRACNETRLDICTTAYFFPFSLFEFPPGAGGGTLRIGSVPFSSHWLLFINHAAWRNKSLIEMCRCVLFIILGGGSIN